MHCHPVAAAVEAARCDLGTHPLQEAARHTHHHPSAEAEAAGQNHREAPRDTLQALPAAGQILGLAAVDRILAAQEAAQEAAHIPVLEAADHTLVPEAADQTPVPGAAGQTPVPEAVDQTPVPEAADQTPVPEAAGQTLAPAAVGQTLAPAAVGQTLEVRQAAARKPAAVAADQIQTAHPEADQIPADQIHRLAAGQTLAAPAAYQKPEAAAGPQIQEVPQARPEERRKSHRTCRRASLVLRNEGSSWSPSRHGGPNRRPHRRQHTVLCTPRIKIEVEFVHRQPPTSVRFKARMRLHVCKCAHLRQRFSR